MIENPRTFPLPKHWRQSFDGNYLGEWNLYDGDKGRHKIVSLKIEKVTNEEVVSVGGKRDKALVLRFVGKRLPMIVTVTNGKILASQFGTLDPSRWVGREFKLGTEQKKVKGVMAHVLRVVAPSSRSEELKEELAPSPEPDTFDDAERQPGDD